MASKYCRTFRVITTETISPFMCINLVNGYYN